MKYKNTDTRIHHAYYLEEEEKYRHFDSERFSTDYCWNTVVCRPEMLQRNLNWTQIMNEYLCIRGKKTTTKITFKNIYWDTLRF